MFRLFVRRPNGSAGSGSRPTIPGQVVRHLWTLFGVLALLQALDLATTYLALSTGMAHEGNPFLAALIFTPRAPLVKVLPLVFLAALIVSGTYRGRPDLGRLVVVARLLVFVYIAIVVNNVVLVVRLR